MDLDHTKPKPIQPIVIPVPDKNFKKKEERRTDQTHCHLRIRQEFKKKKGGKRVEQKTYMYEQEPRFPKTGRKNDDWAERMKQTGPKTRNSVWAFNRIIK